MNVPLVQLLLPGQKGGANSLARGAGVTDMMRQRPAAEGFLADGYFDAKLVQDADGAGVDRGRAHVARNQQAG